MSFSSEKSTQHPKLANPNVKDLKAIYTRIKLFE